MSHSATTPGNITQLCYYVTNCCNPWQGALLAGLDRLLEVNMCDTVW